MADLLAQASAHGLETMFYVYLISSNVKKWVYVGITGNLEERIKRHNTGREKITKPYLPFELIFVQQVESRIEARELEKFLKIRFNKEAILDLIAGVAKRQTR